LGKKKKKVSEKELLEVHDWLQVEKIKVEAEKKRLGKLRTDLDQREKHLNDRAITLEAAHREINARRKKR
jgi:hypothetical protein